MKTYLINHLRIPGDIPNDDGLTYLEKVEATVAPYGGKWLAQGAPDATLEGAWPGSVVLMEFPDRTAVSDWYNSPEYARLIEIRKRCANTRIIALEGITTPIV